MAYHSRCLAHLSALPPAAYTGGALQINRLLPSLIATRTISGTVSTWQAQNQPQQPQATSTGTAESSTSESAEPRSSGPAGETGGQQAAGSQAEELKQNFSETFSKVNETVKSGFENVQETVKTGFASFASGFKDSSAGSNESGSSGSEGERKTGDEGAGHSDGASGSSRSRPSILHTIAHEIREVIVAKDSIHSATKIVEGAIPLDKFVPSGPSELVLVKPKETAWQKKWNAFKEKYGQNKIFQRLNSFNVSDSTAYKKGSQLVEDLKERYETSDNPVVHKVEEVKGQLFTASEPARAMREIRVRDPAFDMNRFVQMVKLDALPVTQAFLRHDLTILSQHCGGELLERFSGIFKHFEEQGLYEDPTILFVGDVEIVEVRMMDDDPFIIAQFQCQQLKCTRDKFGNIIEGAGDSIQRVFYFWGLQQEKQGCVTPELKVLPPRWVIRDMMWQSMLALV